MPEHAAPHDTSTEEAPAGPGRSQRLAGLTLIALIALVLMAVAFLSYMQPIRADDFSNLNVMRDNPGLFTFVRYWYTGWTGRATGMLFLWLGLSFKAGFAVVNALAFGLLSWLTLAVARARLPRVSVPNLTLLGLVMTAYWFALPSISETVFWTTGATAYLWAAVLMLGAILPYRIFYATDRHASPSMTGKLAAAFGMLALGVAAGASQEQVAAALVLCALAMLVGLARSGRLPEAPAWLWAGLVGLALGIAIQAISPGNAIRSAVTPVDTISIGGRLVAFVQYLISVFDVWLAASYGWAVALFGIALVVRTPGDRRRDGSLWWLWSAAAMTTLGIFIAQPKIANLAGARTVLFGAVLLLLAGLSPLRDAAERQDAGRWHRALPFVTAALLLIVLGSAVYNGSHAWKFAKELRAREILIEQQLDKGIRDITVSPTTTGATRVMNFVDITDDPGYWTNKAAAQYYGADSLRLETEPVAP